MKILPAMIRAGASCPILAQTITQDITDCEVCCAAYVASLGTSRTSRDVRLESANWIKADIDKIAATNRAASAGGLISYEGNVEIGGYLYEIGFNRRFAQF